MIHKGGRPHRCNQCEKTFIFKFDLNRHMKIHLERGHSCNKCGKSFLKQISLDEHILKCKRSPQTNGFRYDILEIPFEIKPSWHDKTEIGEKEASSLNQFAKNEKHRCY